MYLCARMQGLVTLILQCKVEDYPAFKGEKYARLGEKIALQLSEDALDGDSNNYSTYSNAFFLTDMLPFASNAPYCGDFRSGW